MNGLWCKCCYVVVCVKVLLVCVGGVFFCEVLCMLCGGSC